MTIRISTAKAVKELAKANGMTIDDLLKELITNQNIANQNKKRITCSLCGVKLKAVNMSKPYGQDAPKISHGSRHDFPEGVLFFL